MVEREPHLERWSPQVLFQRLVGSGQTGEVGLEQFRTLPRILEIGVMQGRMDALRAHTLETHNEAGLAITYDPITNKILIDLQYIEGIDLGDGQEAVPVDISYGLTQTAKAQIAQDLVSDAQIDGLYDVINGLNSNHPAPGDALFGNEPESELLRKYVRRPIGTMHSHPNEVPFSVGDMALFLHTLGTARLSFHLLIRPGGITEALIMTPQTRMLDADGMHTKYAEWDRAVHERVAKLTGNSITPDRPKKFTKANEEMALKVARAYQFGWYQSSPAKPGLLRRVR